MKHNILAICLDCGDTLVDEATEVKTPAGVSLRADLIPGADELMRQLKQRGYPLALVADGPAETFPNTYIPTACMICLMSTPSPHMWGSINRIPIFSTMP